MRHGLSAAWRDDCAFAGQEFQSVFQERGRKEKVVAIAFYTPLLTTRGRESGGQPGRQVGQWDESMVH